MVSFVEKIGSWSGAYMFAWWPFCTRGSWRSLVQICSVFEIWGSAASGGDSLVYTKKHEAYYWGSVGMRPWLLYSKKPHTIVILMACGPKFQVVMSILRRDPSAHHWAFSRIDIQVSVFKIVINHRPSASLSVRHPLANISPHFLELPGIFVRVKKNCMRPKILQVGYITRLGLGIVFRPQILPKKKESQATSCWTRRKFYFWYCVSAPYELPAFHCETPARSPLSIDSTAAGRTFKF